MNDAWALAMSILQIDLVKPKNIYVRREKIVDLERRPLFLFRSFSFRLRELIPCVTTCLLVI